MNEICFHYIFQSIYFFIFFKIEKIVNLTQEKNVSFRLLEMLENFQKKLSGRFTISGQVPTYTFAQETFYKLKLQITFSFLYKENLIV